MHPSTVLLGLNAHFISKVVLDTMAFHLKGLFYRISNSASIFFLAIPCNKLTLLLSQFINNQLHKCDIQ